MKSKAPLAMIELLIMLLVFALGAALCLRAFSLANNTSRVNEMRDTAVIEAQNAAEILKHHSGDYSTAVKLYGGDMVDNEWHISYDKDWQKITGDGKYILHAIPMETSSKLLNGAKITVSTDDVILFELSVSWQTEEE